MRKNRLLTTYAAIAAILAACMAWAAEETKKETKPEAEFQYVGAKKCKGCHKDQHASWLETKHAKAFEVLSDEEKKKAECVGCHITGEMSDGTVLEGVQCEACHGPGSEYKSLKIMNRKKWAADPETYKKKAIEAGLIYPTEENCKRCHKKEGNPNFKEFDFAKRKPLVHVMKSATTETTKTKESAPSPSKEAKGPGDATGKK
ncbi:MAG: multiheme c-type cytochrome [Candidatus Zixiibacteriota bacterium]